MRPAITAILVAVAAMTSVPIAAQDAFELVHVMPFGEPGPVAAVGDLAIYGITSGIMVVDVADPASPVRLSRLAIPGQVNDVVVDDNRVVVAAGDAGVAVVDLADPTAPSLIRVFDTPGDAREVAVSGNWVFVADDDGGFRSIDLSGEPADGSVIAIPGARDVAVDGQIALVDGNPDLWVVDVSDPGSMAATATIPVGVADLAISGTRGFVASYQMGVLVFQLTDPANPVQIGSYVPDGAVWAVDLEDGLVWLSNYAYPDFGGMRVVDFTVPANPVEIGSIDLGSRFDHLAVIGNSAFLGSRSFYDLPVVDVSDPSLPALSSFVPTSSYAGRIVISADLAIVGVGFGYTGYEQYFAVDILDFSDPAAPVDLATLTTPSRIGGYAVDGATVVLVDQDEVLSIFDISKPAAPVLVGTYDLPTQAAGVAVMGDVVYVADYLGFRSIDISDPAAAVQIGFFSTSYYPEMVLGTAGNHVFYGFSTYAFECYGGGFTIVDVTDPTNPFESGFSGSGFPQEFIVVDDRAFDMGTGGCLGNVSIMLGAFDMSANGYPTHMGGEYLGTLCGGGPSITSMTVIGNQLLAGFEEWIFVLDRDDLTNDWTIDLDHTWISSMATIDNFLLAADSGKGLMVFFDQEIFVDDFERGDTSAWAQ